MTDAGEQRSGIVVIAGDGAPLDPLRHGGKACGLQELLRMGLPVPAAIVLPIDAAAEVAEGVEVGVVTRAFADLADALDELRSTGVTPTFAVRSGASISLPGAFETVLDVEPEAVPEAVAAVVASTRGLRVETIVRAMGVDAVPPTAVIVQRQVDATRDDESGAGVVTSRDPVTGEPGLAGSIGWRRRGDAVMAGTIAVEAAASIEPRLPAIAARLRADAARLEEELGSPVEVEIVIEQGELWYVQLRTFDVTMVEVSEAVGEVTAHGRPASPGTATGELHVDQDEAFDAIDAGRAVIIALKTSSPGDVPVMVQAAGVMTVLGSPESHAAVVTRGAGVPAVVAVQGLVIGDHGIDVAGRRVEVGAPVTIDGTRGTVFIHA
ncbi:MAG: hypothetical protein DHS20C19_07910 [Acidimicrobiales bacterium]|nr:MAG: hypothetical protein DHS20C19_07910 [Acidimicrobiales bacterium]